MFECVADDAPDGNLRVLSRAEHRCLSAADLVAGWARDGLPASVASSDVFRVVGMVLPSERVVSVAAQLEARVLGPADAVALLGLWTRLGSWLTAKVDRAIVRVAGPVELGREDWGRDEAALAVRLSPQAAARRVFDARLRCGRLSRVGDALAAGLLLPGQADDAVSELVTASPAVVDVVCDRVLPGAGLQTRAQFGRALARAVIA
ncbi:MAG: hypothetical protein JWM93_3556, partial [Frankiales bacterium]|nr:hypothetical protein [Frankiales bacterium]